MAKKDRKSRKKARRKSRRQNRHHILAQSRIPDGEDKDADNIVMLDADFHAMWHTMFSNLTVEEVHDFIDLIMQPDQLITRKTMERLRNYLKAGGLNDETAQNYLRSVRA